MAMVGDRNRIYHPHESSWGPQGNGQHDLDISGWGQGGPTGGPGDDPNFITGHSSGTSEGYEYGSDPTGGYGQDPGGGYPYGADTAGQVSIFGAKDATGKPFNQVPGGGLYGAFSQLATGARTPYEQAQGLGYAGIAGSPESARDRALYGQLGRYATTQGRGEGEAFNAYQQMLNSGYSPAEANAITQSGMKAARAGFGSAQNELTNRAAASGNAAGLYGAFANLASNQAGTLGEQARQNQITLANERERRREAGAGGMTNIAGLEQRRAEYGMGQQAARSDEMMRRRMGGLQGMGQYAQAGRGLQAAGLAGLGDLTRQADQRQMDYLRILSDILGRKREDYTQGANTTGNFNVGGKGSGT